MPTDVLWIGFNDRKNQMLFEWSDNSQVTFAQWDVDEPSHATNLQEDCVQIRGKVTLRAAVRLKCEVAAGRSVHAAGLYAGRQVGRPHV